MSLQSRFKKPKPAEPINGNAPLLLSLKQASAYIGLPLRQIRNLVAAGTLKKVPTNTKAFYVARVECDRYVRDLIKATGQF